jgi:hypothetical protein
VHLDVWEDSHMRVWLKLAHSHGVQAMTMTEYRSGAKYRTTLIIAPAHISLLNDVFARFIVPLIAVE